MAIFDRVLIVGTGFMGNSLANAIYNNSVANEVHGVEPNDEYRLEALGNGCFTGIEPSIEDLSVEPDLAIVCTPVDLVAQTVCQLLSRFSHSLVTDIASVKQSVVSAVRAAPDISVARFVPGHPITGSDRSGPIRPPASIYTDRSCVITPQDENREEDLASVEQLWSALGSQVFRLNAEDHDLLLGMTSHMPHAVASALSAALLENELEFCGTGIRDSIRIAKSNPLLWKQIFVHNRESVLKAMDRFQIVFDEVRKSIETESTEDLVSILEKGQKNRNALGN